METILLPNISFDKKLAGLTTPRETPVNPGFSPKEFAGSEGINWPEGDLSLMFFQPSCWRWGIYFDFFLGKMPMWKQPRKVAPLLVNLAENGRGGRGEGVGVEYVKVRQSPGKQLKNSIKIFNDLQILMILDLENKI